MPAEKRAPIQETYGCIKWEMKFMPLGETAESQQQSRDELKSLSKQNAPNQDVVKQLTRSTFYTQRKEVNNGKEIKYLLEDWPFLFDEIGMAVHFKELTGVSLKETFVRNLDLKGERLLNYLKTVAVNKSKRLVQSFTNIQLMRREHTGPSGDVLEMVLLLLSYFDEKEDVMFTYVEDTCLTEEVQMGQVPLTPTIVVCGQDATQDSNSSFSIQEGASSLPSVSPGPSSSSRALSPKSTSSSASCSPDVDWADTFDIPWKKFPEELIQSLERGKRPSPQKRREMVRIVVREMMQKSSDISKRHITIVAKKIVATYPKSLQDVIEGDIIGLRFHSLVKQLQNRIENAKRSTTPKSRKRKLHADSDTDEMPAEKRAPIQETYGCIKWEMKFMPLGETAESQQQSRDELKSLSKQNAPNHDVVKQLTRSTFYTQRKEVNNGKEIKYLLEDWPFLFDEIGMAVHFKELTGVSLKEIFVRNLDLKGE
ncbi:Prolyl-tRNA synthetase associated domain-containing 1 [Labeo rohita]|uniref:Prolyl-tRNA synthetase associated domain-containing 1 n=1 Tax=Labeo rohita TaxID=84645 RepID=A0A498MAI3_LABRO|nr:Prolyl-tRNA synthetase associated domain-containing 1 [Labeo rohita]